MRTSALAIVCAIVTLLLAAPLGANHNANLGVFVDQSSRVPYPLDSTTLVVDAELIDAENDGDLDLWISRATLNGTGRTNQLWVNNGTGNFALSARAGTESLDHTDTAFGDVNADGFLDALEGTNLGPEREKLNSRGRFRLAGKSGGLSDTTTDVTIGVALFDADGDGDVDFVEGNECPPPVCTAGGAQSSLWINNGLGVFTDQTATRLPTVLAQTSAVVPGDIDGDGDKDLIVVNGSLAGKQSFVYVNNGAGVFTDETATRLPAQLLSGRDAALVDVDADGDRDLFLVVSRQGQSRLYLNNLGIFTDVTATNLPVQNASFQEVDVIDVNLDGVADFLYLSDTGPTVDGINHIFAGAQSRLWENDGTGRFTDITATHLPAVITQGFSAAIGDIDKDGDLDIIMVSGKGDPIKVYIQQPAP